MASRGSKVPAFSKRERDWTRSDRISDKSVHELKIKADGLVVPPGLEKRLGLSPGDRIELVLDRGRAEILPNIHSLNRLYIEPSSRCNLACRICIRKTWEETTGDMDRTTFGRLTAQLDRFPHLETVMFGGFGEPTVHPDIVSMIRGIKALGLRVEMTTNATLFDDDLIEGLLREKLDRLWISLDGTAKENFETMREGAKFSLVIENLKRLERANRRSLNEHEIEVSIAFVVTRTNLHDMNNLDRLARSVGARRVIVSHVLPYSADLEKEMLCLQTLTLETFTFAPGKIEISLPRMDVNNSTRETIFGLLQGFNNLTVMNNPVFAESRRCRFVHDRSMFVRWDGKISPCMGLLHSHRTILYGLERHVRAHTFGDVRTGDLSGIWNSRAYSAFRENVRAFDFSPCHVCGGCTLLEKNEEDCYGNTFPVCGGCLWAQGVIQCP